MYNIAFDVSGEEQQKIIIIIVLDRSSNNNKNVIKVGVKWGKFYSEKYQFSSFGSVVL